MTLLKVKEVVERLKVSQACVYQLISERRLANVRIGCGRGAIRIAEEDLQAFLEDCKVGQHSHEPAGLKHITLRRGSPGWQPDGDTRASRKGGCSAGSPFA